MTYMIIQADCQTFLDNTRNADLIFADPPFNIGQNYNGYDDKLAPGDFEKFMGRWILRAQDALRPGGTLCVHVPDDLVFPTIRYAAWVGDLEQRDWIIWHYRFAQACNVAKSSKCLSSHCHLLVFGKEPHDAWTWNPPLVPSDRETTYGDRRTEESDTPGMRVALDVWGIPSDGVYWGRVQGNNLERRPGHPNQLPEVYLERIINTWSNPGDLVLDPFCGSGTTGVVAVALGRRFAGCDISAAHVESARERMKKGAVRVWKKTR